MPKKGFVIAIDGPVASGKGTLAHKLAQQVNGFYLYTGAMYRSIALLCINKGLNLEDESEVIKVLSNLNIEFTDGKVILNGHDVTERLKKPDTASGASVVGVYKKVREKSVKLQQAIAEKAVAKGLIVVAEGRDTGTVVFPQAAFKIYLTAKPEIRAMRRMEQYIKEDKDLQKELEQLKIRDKRDQERVVSPLPIDPEAQGYFVLDNSNMIGDEALNVVKDELGKRNLLND